MKKEEKEEEKKKMEGRRKLYDKNRGNNVEHEILLLCVLTSASTSPSVSILYIDEPVIE